ncbi:MAG: hypothetical protein ACI85O_000810 [Saprospiraceae bacterium]|jgi:hypothetical protein
MKITVIIIGLLILTSCARNQNEEWCTEGIERAKKEIKKEGLIFVKYLTLVDGSDSYDDELIELLKESKIGFRYDAISCLDTENEDKERICYQKTMLKGIENIHGGNFIEEISRQAKERYISK